MPRESEVLYAQIDPRLRREFDASYAQLVAPLTAGAFDKFQAELDAVDTLLHQAELEGFVPLSNYPGGGVRIAPRANGGAAPPRRAQHRSPVAFFKRMSPQRRAIIGIIALFLVGSLALWWTIPRGDVAALAPAPTAPAATSQAPAALPGGAMQTAVVSATQTVSTTAAFPASDNPSALQSAANAAQAVVEERDRDTLLTPVNLEYNDAKQTEAARRVYRVVPSQPAGNGTWRPQLQPGEAAWLEGTVINRVFCVPAKDLPKAAPGDALTIRPKSAVPLRYTITTVDTTVEWQQTDWVNQLKNGVTVIGCGSPPEQKKTVWFAAYRLSDRPDPPPPPTATQPIAQLAPLDVQQLDAKVATDPTKGSVMVMTLAVGNHTDDPVTIEKDALQVLDGSNSQVLPLLGGLPITIPAVKEPQPVVLAVQAPAKEAHGTAVLKSNALFGSRSWPVTPKP
jgi:hypothetical protein